MAKRRRARRGAGSTYKRGATWWLAYRTPDGQQHCESAKTEDRKTAEALLKSRLAQIVENRFSPEGAKLTVWDLCELTLNDYRLQGRKTLLEAQGRVSNHVLPFFQKDRKATEITTALADAFIAQRLADGARPGTINRELNVLRHGFTLAKRSGLLASTPYMRTLSEADGIRRGTFTEDEYRRVLAALPERLRAPISLAYHCGWRLKSEVFRLTWDRVDFDAGYMKLATSKNGEPRLFPLTHVEVRAILEAQWQKRLPDNPLVFPNSRGKVFNHIDGAWKRALKEAGLPEDRKMHDFRRTALTNFRKAGLDSTEAMALSGHKDVRVFQRYDVPTSERLNESARKLNEANSRRMTTDQLQNPLSEEESEKNLQ